MTDGLLFADDQSHADGSTVTIGKPETPWNILVVDDEADVHTMTKIVLRSYTFDGRPLRFLSAYSADEAETLLQREAAIAVVLLDVVMEREDSGLELVRYIRNTLGNTQTRIILRTGQPGFAPEEEVTTKYDINDYKEKSELTKPKLFACLTTAIRSYRDISTIEKSRTELQRIIESAAEIFKLRSMRDFCQAVLQQLAYLLAMNNPAVHLQTTGFVASFTEKDFNVIASIGRFSDLQDEPSGVPACLLPEIEAVLRSRHSQYRKKWYFAYFETDAGLKNIVCIECYAPIEPLVLDHIKLFNINVGIALNNLYLNRDIVETQRELIYFLGEIVESRSKETCYHIHRVSAYTELLAVRMGLGEADVILLKTASIMHDVGKMGIPDSILNKPGKLTPEEFTVMKTHTSIGHRLLQASDKEMFHAAAEIALFHHERWDGNGYPEGLKGTDIPLSARIVAVADVFDALSVDRVYRPAWQEKDVWAFIHDGSGTAFDPEIVHLFEQARDEITAIKRQYIENKGSHE